MHIVCQINTVIFLSRFPKLKSQVTREVFSMNLQYQKEIEIVKDKKTFQIYIRVNSTFNHFEERDLWLIAKSSSIQNLVAFDLHDFDNSLHTSSCDVFTDQVH